MPQCFRLGYFGALIFFLTIVCGCIHLEQSIQITEKNSGIFKINFAIPVELYKTLAPTNSGSEEMLLSRYFDPTFGTSIYSEANGFRLNQFRVYERGDTLNVLIEGEILDLQRAINSKLLGDFSLVTKGHGNLLLSLKLDIHQSLHTEWNSTVSAEKRFERKEQLKEMIAGMRLSLTIQVPHEIIKSSAPLVNTNTVQWVFDPADNDQFLFNPPEIYVEYR